jgi:hypothetical protein
MAPGPRLLWLAGVPLAWALLLVFHPNDASKDIYDGVNDELTAWLVVHVGTMVFIPLMAVTILVLLRDVPGRAASVSRWAMVPFVIFYLAWEAVTGVGTGVLVDEGGGRELVNNFYANPIAGEPGVFNVIGGAAWVVALIAAAIAIRKAGAPLVAAILVGVGAIAAAHPFPYGPTALVCLAAGAVIYERSRTRASASRPARA